MFEELFELPPPNHKNTAPSIELYHPKEIKLEKGICVGRIRKDMRHDKKMLHYEYRRYVLLSGLPTRVYLAQQCCKPTVGEEDLCKTCLSREKRYFESPDELPSRRAQIDWNGRVTESLDLLPPESHIAGSQWFKTKIKWGPSFIQERVEKQKNQCPFCHLQMRADKISSHCRKIHVHDEDKHSKVFPERRIVKITDSENYFCFECFVLFKPKNREIFHICKEKQLKKKSVKELKPFEIESEEHLIHSFQEYITKLKERIRYLEDRLKKDKEL